MVSMVPNILAVWRRGQCFLQCYKWQWSHSKRSYAITLLPYVTMITWPVTSRGWQLDRVALRWSHF